MQWDSMQLSYAPLLLQSIIKMRFIVCRNGLLAEQIEIGDRRKSHYLQYLCHSMDCAIFRISF